MSVEVRNIKWCFDCTEFVSLQYSEAVKIAGLPKKVLIEESDIDLEEDIEQSIENYLMENFGFEIESFKVEVED